MALKVRLYARERIYQRKNFSIKNQKRKTKLSKTTKRTKDDVFLKEKCFKNYHQHNKNS